MRNKIIAIIITVAYLLFADRVMAQGAEINERAYAKARGETITYQKGFLNEPALFSYRPHYHPNQVTFNLDRQAMIRDANLGIQYFDNGWKRMDLKPALIAFARRKKPESNWTPTVADMRSIANVRTDQRVLTDYAGTLYTLVNATAVAEINNILLFYSRDGGITWKTTALNVGYGMSIAMESGRAGLPLTGPPTLVRHPSTGEGAFYSDPSLPYCHLLFYYEIVANSKGDLIVGRRIVISKRSILGAYPSATNNVSLTTEKEIYFFYPINTTFWEGEDLKGTVIVGRILNRESGLLSKEFFVSAAPAPYRPYERPYIVDHWGNRLLHDDHDMITFARDSQGFIHAIVGSHGYGMYYLRSKSSRNVARGFVRVQYIELGAQAEGWTYPNLVMDGNDNISVTARFRDKGAVDSLVYISKPAHHSVFNLQRMVKIADAGRKRYGHFNHRTTVDPWGRVWVTYAYTPGALSAEEAVLYKKRYRLNELTVGQNADGTESCYVERDASKLKRCFYNELVARDHVLVRIAPQTGPELATAESFR